MSDQKNSDEKTIPLPTLKNVWKQFWVHRSNTEKDSLIEKTSLFLSKDESIKTVTDMGCGSCILKQYLNPKQEYIGIDGSDTGYQTKIVDLVEYKDQTDAVYMKHILEHNYAWKQILSNFLQSFTKKGILILFTPWSKTTETTVLKDFVIEGTNSNGKKVKIPDLSFSKKEMLAILDAYKLEYEGKEKKKTFSYVLEELSVTGTVYNQDNVFYFTKS